MSPVAPLRTAGAGVAGRGRASGARSECPVARARALCLLACICVRTVHGSAPGPCTKRTQNVSARTGHNGEGVEAAHQAHTLNSVLGAHGGKSRLWYYQGTWGAEQQEVGWAPCGVRRACPLPRCVEQAVCPPPTRVGNCFARRTLRTERLGQGPRLSTLNLCAIAAVRTHHARACVHVLVDAGPHPPG